MSFDIDWPLLDVELADRYLASVNSALSSLKRPGVLGEITATSFSFGSASPELELVEIRDVFEQFLHLEDDVDVEDGAPGAEDDRESAIGGHDMRQRSPKGGAGMAGADEIILGSPVTASSTLGGLGAGLARPLVGTPGLFSPTASTPGASLWLPRSSIASNTTLPLATGVATGRASSNTPSLAGFPFPQAGIGQCRRSDNDSRDRAARKAALPPQQAGPAYLHDRGTPSPSIAAGDRHGLAPGNSSGASTNISVQLHFRLRYTGNASMTIQTSLRVNYPSLSFMSLPLHLRLSGFAFAGLLAVAYEGDRKRLHVSLLEDDMPNDGSNGVARGMHAGESIGSKLLRSIVVESEVGHLDKLVLKDVENIEQFILHAARKALEVSEGAVQLGHKLWLGLQYFASRSPRLKC